MRRVLSGLCSQYYPLTILYFLSAFQQKYVVRHSLFWQQVHWHISQKNVCEIEIHYYNVLMKLRQLYYLIFSWTYLKVFGSIQFRCKFNVGAEQLEQLATAGNSWEQLDKVTLHSSTFSIEPETRTYNGSERW